MAGKPTKLYKLSTRVPRAFKTDFVAFCKATGMTMEGAILRAIEEYMKSVRIRDKELRKAAL
jgi:hypothetical protein